MNVGIITTWFDRGAAYVSKAYMDTLSKSHNVYIYARGGEYYAKNDPNWDLLVVFWENPVPGKPYMYINWNEFEIWLKDNEIEILIFNEQQDWDVIIRLQKMNIIIGAYIDYYTQETASFYWAYDFLLCNTKRHYGVFKDHPQSVFIPWGTNIELYQPQKTKLSKDCIVFFHSCGVSPNRKGTEVLVKAFSQVSGNAKLIIHSQIPLDKEFPALFQMIKNNPNISLIEQTIPPPGLYYMGDVYVYPTILEGIGLTIAEALSCGLPVITTNEPPMSEFIVDGENGKLVDVATYQTRIDHYYWKQSFCDLHSLTQAIQYYIDRNKEIHLFKQNARLFAENNLDWKKNSQKVPNILENFNLIHNKVDPELINKIQIYENKRIKLDLIDSPNILIKIKSIIKKIIQAPNTHT